MKNKITLILLILLFYIVFYQKIIPYNKIIFSTLLYSFVPCLFPLFILINTFIESDGITYFYNKLKTTKFRRQLFYVFICFLLLNIGIPNSITIVNNLYNKNIISSEEKNKLFSSVGIVSFPFVYGICLSNIIDKNLSLFILIIYIVVNIAFLYIQGFKINFDQNITITKNSNREIFNKSLTSSIKSIIIIVTTIMISSSFLFLINNIAVPFNYFIQGLIEFSYPSYNLSSINDHVSLTLLMFILSFPSFSTLLQIKLIDRNFKIIPFIRKRSVISITIVIIFIFFSFLYITK